MILFKFWWILISTDDFVDGFKCCSYIHTNVVHTGCCSYILNNFFVYRLKSNPTGDYINVFFGHDDGGYDKAAYFNRYTNLCIPGTVGN